ncbi:hypothetical protein J7E90_32920 [Streptomyces sp. ISL-111]|uniref:hypothetical protein n=1 Tax=unclassified Streptomyces TaxID=2593676 RepID=UPI001BECD412|nr:MULTISPECIES: hypothetical protein [unclassified Streptomyces]MBT2381948.1 hypothetical protein [Streptomyces sp. ISL-111]MBT2427237.1 hypothetical protein [Streptomyces sp. ISL-112]
MNGEIIPRDQAIAAARAVLDRARVRIARDRAAGRLSPEHELILRRIERDQRLRAAAEQTAHRDAA